MDNVIVHRARVCANKTSARGCTELYIKGGSRSVSSITLVSQSVAKGILLFSWAISLDSGTAFSCQLSFLYSLFAMASEATEMAFLQLFTFKGKNLSKSHLLSIIMKC